MKKRASVWVVLVVHLVSVTLTWRDLSRRTPAEVRGNRWVWRVASGANTLGSIAYWLVGRRPRRTGTRVTPGPGSSAAGRAA